VWHLHVRSLTIPAADWQCLTPYTHQSVLNLKGPLRSLILYLKTYIATTKQYASTQMAP